MEALRQAISEFDGKAVSILSEARAKFRGGQSYYRDLTVLSLDSNARISDGATWILKAELEEASNLPPKLTAMLLASLNKITSWQAALHICQLIGYLDTNENQAALIIEWARPFTRHKRPFLRAWSTHAIAVLGKKFACHQVEADLALKNAEKDGAASVRARARRLRAL